MVNKTCKGIGRCICSFGKNERGNNGHLDCLHDYHLLCETFHKRKIQRENDSPSANRFDSGNLTFGNFFFATETNRKNYLFKIIFGTLFSYLFHFKEKWHVVVIGEIPIG